MKKIYILALIINLVAAEQLFAQPAWVRKQATPQENTLNDITRIPGTNKLIAVGEGSTVMISEDAGESWQIILHPAGFNNQYISNSIHFINENTGYIGGSYNSILRTTDGGYTWTKIMIDSTGHFTFCITTLDFFNDNVGFALGYNGDIFSTSNSGLQWEESNINTYFIPASLEILDSNKGFIIGYMTNEFLQTDDGGLTWDSIGKPSGLPDNAYIYSISFINDKVGFINIDAPGGNEIYRTADGGLTWANVCSDYSLFDCRFCFADDLNGIAVFVDYAYHNEILLTHDGGLTWEHNTTDHLPWYSANAIEFVSPDTYVTVGRHIGNMNRSTDGGIHWESSGKHDFKGDIDAVEVFDDHNLIAIAENIEGGVIQFDLKKSTDWGRNWSKVYSESYYSGDIDFINPDTGFLLTNFNDEISVNRTLDGGLNWESFDICDGFRADDITFYDYYHGMVTSEFRVFKTSDAGETWENITDGLIEGVVYSIEYISSEKVIGLGHYSLNSCIYISENGGNSWQEKSIGDYYDPTALFALNDTTYFVATYNRIFKTTDGGNSWLQSTIVNNHPILINSIYFPSPDTGYAVGEGQYENALRTIDGGLTWTVSETNSSTRFCKVYFKDNLNGLAFGNLGVVMETTTGGVADAKKPDNAAEQIYFTPQPNPFTDQLVLHFINDKNPGKCTLTVTDLTGKTIKTISVGGKIDRLLLNLPDLSAGVYLLNLYKGNQLLQSEKVVKQ